MMLYKKLIQNFIVQRHFGRTIFNNRKGVMTTPIPCRYVNNEEGD